MNFRKGSKILSLLLVLLMLFSFVPAHADTDFTVTRIAGMDRYDTSIQVSKATFKTSAIAILASGESFPDALVGGALASQISAPILTVPKDNIPNSALEELDRLEVSHILILGGANTISEKVENTLKERYEEVERIAGEDRYATASAVNTARHIFNRAANGEDVKGGDKMSYVSGTSFADALTAAPFIGQLNDGGPFFTMEAFLLAKPNEEVYAHKIFGGEASVKGTAVHKRVAGADRFETAVQIANLYPEELGKEIDTVVIANGLNYPDALASAPLVATRNAALLLTSPSKLTPVTKTYIESNNIKNIVIIGGENSVSSAVVNEITGKTVEPEPIPEPEPTPEPEPDKVLYDVLRVIDGDTIEVMIQGVKEKVRLIGVDTPESVHPDPDRNTECGKIASEFTKSRLEGKKVELELDVQERDKYGRVLAYVYLDGIMFNKTLLKEGMAKVSTYPPNVKYVEDFLALQQEAREANRGLWGSDCNHENPDPKPNPEPKPEPGPSDPAYLYANGRIIGNKNSMIYHMPGQRDYKKVLYKNAVFFDTEADALAANYRKAKR